tara:strand:+ start:2579 stop:3019 length:441 start_codon:yes stop_codon:yes gene_type:complete
LKLNNLKPPPSLDKNRKRLGRGRASGSGKTAGRGNKGYHSRSGSKQRPWFEGGQMPLQRRVPKRGFSNSLFKKEFQIISIAKISKLGLKKIDLSVMIEKKIIRNLNKPVKVLANGNIDKSVEIFANAFSETAIKKIEKNGGKAHII